MAELTELQKLEKVLVDDGWRLEQEMLAERTLVKEFEKDDYIIRIEFFRKML